MSCEPGAWGGSGCLKHEGHHIGPDGFCVEGRRLVVEDDRGPVLRATQEQIDRARAETIPAPPEEK